MRTLDGDAVAHKARAAKYIDHKERFAFLKAVGEQHGLPIVMLSEIVSSKSNSTNGYT